jgi:hypothetical protein
LRSTGTSIGRTRADARPGRTEAPAREASRRRT